jgi:hypothetical protein
MNGRALAALAAVLLGSAALGRAPAPGGGKVKPGQVATSKPGALGLVTQLRPAVTRLAPDDPFRIALHWAKSDRPLRSGDAPSPVLYEATLASMTFHLTTPAGDKLALKLAGEPAVRGGSDLFYRPTYLLTLTKDGLEEEGAKKWAWAGAKRPNLAAEGVYRLRVTGTLMGQKEAAVPFASETIAVEVSRTARSQAKAVQIARDALRAQPGLDLSKADVFVRDDEAGNTVVRFRTPGKLWSHVDWTVKVRPDGKTERPTSAETFTCVARGAPIATEKGPRPVEQVRVGDRVWAYDARTGKRVLTPVEFIRVGEAQHTVMLGGRLRVTAEHPVWVGEWRPAGRVGAQDRLLDEGLRRVAAGEPRWVSGRVQVYDLSVGDPHCFFAAGYLVHNKRRAWTPRLDDPWYDRWPEMLPKGK